MSSATGIWPSRRTHARGCPLDHDTSAWMISLLFHLVALVVVTLLFTPVDRDTTNLTVIVPLADEDDSIQETKEFKYDPRIQKEIGAGRRLGVEEAWGEGPNTADESIIPNPELYVQSEIGHIALQEEIEIPSGPHLNQRLSVRGAAGVGATSALGAIDRITHEILLQLQQRKVLVVWLFDRSGSLQQQREEIIARFDRVYEELGVIAASGNEVFKRYQDKPLLTSIIAFGQDVTLRTKKPTDDMETLKTAISDIERDDSGIERAFSAVHMAADHYKRYRRRNVKTGEPLRNILLIVVTDEVGNDQHLLEPVIKVCRRHAIAVHIVGVPAPFGRTETLIKWVDPDPNYDQRPQWGRVSQGPESLLPECVKLHFSGAGEDTALIDSGFGPFALTRLCYETGGVYIAVHPNRNTHRAVSESETAVSSAYFKHFFDPKVMRKYRPDYVSPEEYHRRLANNAARAALVRSAQMSWVTPLEGPRRRFPKRSEADLANRLTEAQKQAAVLEPKVNALHETLKFGEKAREKEKSPRWRAGYDLAMGRVLAAKVRTEAYNAMLSKAKRGMKFGNPKSDTWILRPSDDISVGSQLEKLGEKAHIYLNRVISEHAHTPWALLAKRELREPLGWTWDERFMGINVPRGNPNPPAAAPSPPPRDDRVRMIERPRPRRSPPPL